MLSPIMAVHRSWIWSHALATPKEKWLFFPQHPSSTSSTLARDQALGTPSSSALGLFWHVFCALRQESQCLGWPSTRETQVCLLHAGTADVHCCAPLVSFEGVVLNVVWERPGGKKQKKWPRGRAWSMDQNIYTKSMSFPVHQVLWV